MMLPTILMLLAPVTQSRYARATDSGRFDVLVHETEEGPLLTVYADNTPVDKVVERIGRETGMQVTGLADVATLEPVALYFERRPLRESIHWIVGAAGLRAQLSSDTIRVYDDTPPFPTSSELFDLAEVAWIRALRHHPEHPEGAAAEMALAEIQEQRGALAAAVNHYEYLIERYFDSEYTPEAMLVSGIHLGELGEWNAAARRFQELSRLERPHPYGALARLELARALCYSSQPQSALYTLDALELDFPAESDQDKRVRLVLRARALALLGKAVEALRALDLAREYSLGSEPGLDVLEVRAMALERSGRLGEASVGWLQLADETTGPLHVSALESSARCALGAGDELGVLFIEAWANRKGSADAVEPFAVEARMRIGIETDSLVHLDDDQRLEHGKNLLEAGMSDQAVRVLQALHGQRDRLSSELQLELALTYARALESEALTDLAVEVLREAATRQDDPDSRRRIYVTASTIYEENGRLQEALDALEGRL